MIQWTTVIGWPDYIVSDTGLVYSLRSEQFMKGIPDEWGYHRVRLSDSPRRTLKAIHQIVLEAFVGPRPERRFVARHLDGNKYNNTPTNLSWGTARQNRMDAFKHGTAVMPWQLAKAC
jgi:hypothetical protein